MNIQNYLERIDYHGSQEPTVSTLRALHEAHLLVVPFENLDIHLGRKIILDVALLEQKIVEQRRGGFCYELNGLFAELLRELGFSVDLISARVAQDQGTFSPEFDHLTLIVHLEQDWLVDVGFGDCFRFPVLFQEKVVHTEERRAYKLEHTDGLWVLWEQREGEEWASQYQFAGRPRMLQDFADRCEYQQSSPESHFKKKRVCSLLTENGRITLSEQRLITTIEGVKTEQDVSSEEYDEILRERFGIVL